MRPMSTGRLARLARLAPLAPLALLASLAWATDAPLPTQAARIVTDCAPCQPIAERYNALATRHLTLARHARQLEMRIRLIAENAVRLRAQIAATSDPAVKARLTKIIEDQQAQADIDARMLAKERAEMAEIAAQMESAMRELRACEESCRASADGGSTGQTAGAVGSAPLDASGASGASGVQERWEYEFDLEWKRSALRVRTPEESPPILPPPEDWELEAAAALDVALSLGEFEPELYGRTLDYLRELRENPELLAQQREHARWNAAVQLANLERQQRLALLDAESDLRERRDAATRATRAFIQEAEADGVWTAEEDRKFWELHDAETLIWQPTAEEEAKLAALQQVREQVSREIATSAFNLGGLAPVDVAARKSRAGVAETIIDWQNADLPLLGEVNLTFTGDLAGQMSQEMFAAREKMLVAENLMLAADIYRNRTDITSEQRMIADEIWWRAYLAKSAAMDVLALDSAVILLGTSADFAFLGLGRPIGWLGGKIGGGIRSGFWRAWGRTFGRQAGDVAGDLFPKAPVDPKLRPEHIDPELHVWEGIAQEGASKGLELGIKEDLLREAVQGATDPVAFVAQYKLRYLAKLVDVGNLRALSDFDGLIQQALDAGVPRAIVDDILARARSTGTIEAFVEGAANELGLATLKARGGRIAVNIVDGSPAAPAHNYGSAKEFWEQFGETLAQKNPPELFDDLNAVEALYRAWKETGQIVTSTPEQGEVLARLAELSDEGVRALYALDDLEGRLVVIADEAFLTAVKEKEDALARGIRAYLGAPEPPANVLGLDDTIPPWWYRDMPSQVGDSSSGSWTGLGEAPPRANSGSSAAGPRPGSGEASGGPLRSGFIFHFTPPKGGQDEGPSPPVQSAGIVIRTFPVGNTSLWIASLPAGSPVPDTAQLQRIAGGTGAALLEPDLARAKASANDPHYQAKGSWGQGYDDQWALKRIGIEPLARPAATRPVTSIREGRASAGGDERAPVIAIVDTGLDWHHPDFAEERLWRNVREVPGNGIDDDRNGYVDDVIGWDFVDYDNAPWDRDGHGTFIAGVIAARTGNGQGIAGVDPHARIMALRALDGAGNTRASYLAEAIVYAANNGARIINVSASGAGLTRAEQLAIEYARSKSALVIVAAGNDAAPLANRGPGGVGAALTVAATDPEDRRARFSNYGDGIDLAAPGVDVLSLRGSGTNLLRGAASAAGAPSTAGAAEASIVGADRAYIRATGTSFAAPFVSGVAARVLAARPQLTVEELERVLLQSARDVEAPGVDHLTGYGVLDARAALAADEKAFVDARITGVRVEAGSGAAVIEVLGSAVADRFAGARLELGAGETPSAWNAAAAPRSVPVENGVLFRLRPDALRGSRTWILRLVVERDGGARREARFRLQL